jgi:hypothetical protein
MSSMTVAGSGVQALPSPPLLPDPLLLLLPEPPLLLLLLPPSVGPAGVVELKQPPA